MLSFKLLEQYLSNTNINLVIAKNGDELTVSLLPQPKIKDEAKSNLRPIFLKGTAEELDEQFHTLIEKPLQKVSGIVSNIKDFEESADKLAKESKAAGESKKQDDKNKEKADKLLEEAKAFVTSKEYSKAKLKVEAALKFVPNYDKANKMSEEITKLDVPDLFVAIEEEKQVEEIKTKSVETIMEGEPITIKEIAEASPNIVIASIPKVEEEKQEEPKKSLFDSIQETRANVNVVSSKKEITQEELDDLYSDKEDPMKPNEDTFNSESSIIDDELF